MNKLNIIGLCAAIGLIALATPARALPAVDVPVSLTAGNTPVGNASGSYHVAFTSLGGNAWRVTVQGNNDGKGSPGNPSGLPVKHSVESMSIGFRDSTGALIKVVTGGRSGSNTDNGGANGIDLSNTAAWNLPVTNQQTAAWAVNDEGQGIDAFGNNVFTGTWKINNTNPNAVTSFSIALQDGGMQWSYDSLTSTVTPEPGTLALAMSGLAPLGLLLLQRRRRPLPDGTEESTA